MRLLRLFLRRSPRRLALAIFLGLASGAAAAALVSVINEGIARQDPAGLMAPFAGLCVLSIVTSAAAQSAIYALTHGAMFDLRLELSRRLLRVPFARLESFGTARALSILTEDVALLSQSGFILAYTMTSIAVACACGVYLATLSLPTFGLCAGVLGIAFFVQRFAEKAADRRLEAAREDQDVLAEGFQGITDGAKELKLHPARRRTYVEEAIELPARRYRDHQMVVGLLAFVSSNFLALCMFLLIGLLIFVWPTMWPIDTATIASFVVTLLFLEPSIEGLVLWLIDIARGEVVLERFEELTGAFEDAKEQEVSAPARREGVLEIRLRNVVHAYRDDLDHPFTLGPINLAIRGGEVLFVVGGNGSGKSTLVKILCGLYAPSQGEISVDGKAVVEGDAYRQLFSAVFADWYLFDKLYGLEGKDEEARRRLVQLRLDAKVSIADGSFSTTNLSLGQRKRLMLLIAYLEDRPVYVFDEWASDQDPVFKKVFYTEILRDLRARGKAVVVVSHDDHYFSVADARIRLEEGMVVSATTPGRPPAGSSA